MCRTFVMTVCYLASLIGAVHAREAAVVSDEAVREAVSRSLPFLEKEGVAWMQEKGCASCHHVPFMLWSHRAAESQGLPVDGKKLAAWDQWTQKDSLSHRNLFRLQNYDLGKLDTEKMPDAVKEKLKPLVEVPFKTEAEFLAKLAPLLTEEELKSYRMVTLQTAERTPYSVDRTGGGLDVIAQLLIASQGTSSILSQSEFRDGAIELMNEIQLPDGSWTPGNQFSTMRRWTLPTANQTTTMWAAIALSGYKDSESKRAAAIDKAVAYVRQQSANTDNHEWLATRLLFEHYLGSEDEVDHLHQQLIDACNSDGGWGWENGGPSDSMTTGLAIYVLAKVRGAQSLTVLRNARAFLIASQQPDGSWLTPSENITRSNETERLRARDEIYHYWGTAWAAIGLLETLEKSGG